MWIRSQDKEFLMKVDNINLGIGVDTKKPNKLFTFVDGVTTSFTLGTYKSKERALEVLDEIQERISPKFNYKGNNEEADLFIKTQILNSMIAVYQMPEA